MTGTMIPKRSESLPMRMPLNPYPIMVSVYGSDASARATPNSACTGGSATTTDHMPTPPMVDNSNAITRRDQAYADSVSPTGTASVLFTAPAAWRPVPDCVMVSPPSGLVIPGAIVPWHDHRLDYRSKESSGGPTDSA